MTSERHVRAKEIFLAASELPAEGREAFLQRACEGDVALDADVRELLEFHRGETDATPPPTEAIDIESIAGYRVLQRVGVGGMGEVYEAEQTAPVRRRVALKVIRWGMDSREVLARFETERQALALMSHAAIARIFDAGTTSKGRPFFAMEFVRGVPITRYCDAQRSTTREHLELFGLVCEGVQHAHQRGVIHRDLKPSNILVTVEDGWPAPKIIDFGVAKAIAQRLTERTLFTELGQWIGTPEYMSPEQAEMTSLDIDTRTDVYSLGVILYELLVGAQPFESSSLRARGFDEMRRRIREDDPPRPSTRVSGLGPDSTVAARRRRTNPVSLARELRGDLDWIVMRALDKDRTRRYPTPLDLAEDVRRHLRDDPVEAGPPSGFYRASKFVRRHRLGVGAAAVTTLLLILGIVGTSFGMARARREAETAKRVVLLMREMLWATGPGSPTGHAMPVRDFLARARDRVAGELAGSPLLQAEMMSILGEVHLSLSELDQATPLLEGALEIRKRYLGADSLDVAHSRNALGVLRLDAGQFATAANLFESALATLEPVLGPRHPTVVLTSANLCRAHWRLGDLDDALARCGQAIEAIATAEGADSVNVATTLLSRAGVRRDLADFAGAAEDDQRALGIFERQLGPAHTLVGWAAASYGVDERVLGHLDASATLLLRALEIQRSSLGPEALAVAFPLEQLAQVKSAQGDVETARGMIERAIEIRERAVGADHPDLVGALRPYGEIARRGGDSAAAARILTRALELSERHFGSAHLETARCLEALGLNYAANRDYERARPRLERAAEIYARVQGAASPITRRTTYNLACVAALQSDRAAALELLGRLVDGGWAWPGALTDPDLDGLRGDPRFEALLARLRVQLGAG